MTLLVAACPSEIYVRDGVTDGNRFYLGNQALDDHDPVLQSWVAYSLAKSVCQLEIGGDNPARNSSYGCEFFARRILLDTWQEMRADNPQLSDDYLNTLTKVRDAAYLDEYVVHYYGKNNWLVPAEIDAKSFHRWRRKHLNGHKPYTRLIGSWGYAEAQTDR
ncbi:MAG: hypothetical protein HKN70_04620 [Gammaproteobacteria bacterium]|nr:hypothetical protein [Gammaproteobacteria bacterium]